MKMMAFVYMQLFPFIWLLILIFLDTNQLFSEFELGADDCLYLSTAFRDFYDVN